MLYSLLEAFAVYSRIPVPYLAPKEGQRVYSICFFPAVGAVIGLLSCLIFRIGEKAVSVGPFPSLLFPALLTALPLIITGGIHYDGFLDTSDARSSYRSREEKLQIMKDPHTGAFAVMHGILLILITFGFFSAADWQAMRITGAGFVLSRAMSGFALLVFPKARKDGMLKAEADRQSSAVKYVMLAEMLLCTALMIALNPVRGGAGAAGAYVTFLLYRRTALREFGGTSGDLAGWFLVRCECAVLICAVSAGLCGF